MTAVDTPGGANTYLYWCVSLLAPVCALCVCVCVCVCMCVISNWGTSKKLHVSDLSKVNTLLHKTYNRVTTTR